MVISREKVEAFIDDLIEVYKKHGLSLSHQDTEGAFIVEPISQNNITWLQQANLGNGEFIIWR